MKSLSLFVALLFGIFSFNISFAQSATNETIKVWGNCGMCKATIEKAARSAGATTASWDEDSKQLIVSYASNKTSGAKIQQAIAKKGYDTQDLTADNKAYEKLHSCCKYERNDNSATTSEKKCCGSNSCKKDKAHEAGNHKDHAAGCKEMDCCKKVVSEN